jgi:hypothetical protein
MKSGTLQSKNPPLRQNLFFMKNLRDSSYRTYAFFAGQHCNNPAIHSIKTSLYEQHVIQVNSYGKGDIP